MIGITVVLDEKTQIGTDSMNNPVYVTTATNVDNVLVGQPETDDVTEGMSCTCNDRILFKQIH